MKTLSLVAVLLLGLFGLEGCGSVCAGTSCQCPQGQTCGFDGCTADTPGCQFDCAADSTCKGSCGSGCQVTCQGKSCTATVGANSQVSCTSGTCSITCQGKCSIGAVGGTATYSCVSGTKTAGGCD